MIAAHIIFFLLLLSIRRREPTLALLLRGPLWLSGSLKSAQTVWSGIFHRVIGAKEQRLGRSWSLAKTPDFLLVSFDVIWDFFFSFCRSTLWPPCGLPPTEPEQCNDCRPCRQLGHSTTVLEVFISIRKHSSGVYWFPEMRLPQAEREIQEIITKHGQLARLSSKTSLCHMAAKPSDTFFYKHLQGEWIYYFFHYIQTHQYKGTEWCVHSFCSNFFSLTDKQKVDLKWTVHPELNGDIFRYTQPFLRFVEVKNSHSGDVAEDAAPLRGCLLHEISKYAWHCDITFADELSLIFSELFDADVQPFGTCGTSCRSCIRWLKR